MHYLDREHPTRIVESDAELPTGPQPSLHGVPVHSEVLGGAGDGATVVKEAYYRPQISSESGSGVAAETAVRR